MASGAWQAWTRSRCSSSSSSSSAQWLGVWRLHGGWGGRSCTHAPGPTPLSRARAALPWIRELEDWLRTAVAASAAAGGRPRFLGVCFGCQVLAAGARGQMMAAGTPAQSRRPPAAAPPPPPHTHTHTSIRAAAQPWAGALGPTLGGALCFEWRGWCPTPSWQAVLRFRRRCRITARQQRARTQRAASSRTRAAEMALHHLYLQQAQLVSRHSSRHSLLAPTPSSSRMGTRCWLCPPAPPAWPHHLPLLMRPGLWAPTCWRCRWVGAGGVVMAHCRCAREPPPHPHHWQGHAELSCGEVMAKIHPALTASGRLNAGASGGEGVLPRCPVVWHASVCDICQPHPDACMC